MKLWIILTIAMLLPIGAKAPLHLVAFGPFAALGWGVIAFVSWIASSIGAVVASGKLLLGLMIGNGLPLNSIYTVLNAIISSGVVVPSLIGGLTIHYLRLNQVEALESEKITREINREISSQTREQQENHHREILETHRQKESAHQLLEVIKRRTSAHLTPSPPPPLVPDDVLSASNMLATEHPISTKR